MASEVDRATRGENICRLLGTTLVGKIHQRRVKKSMKRSPPNAPTQLQVYSECTFSISTLFVSVVSEFDSEWRSKRWHTEALEVIQIMITRFRRVVDNRTYRLANRSTNYDHTVSRNTINMLKWFTAQMKLYIIDPFEPIPFIEILCNFKLAWDTNGIRKDAAVRLFDFFGNTSVSQYSVWCRPRNIGLKPGCHVLDIPDANDERTCCHLRITYLRNMC